MTLRYSNWPAQRSAEQLWASAGNSDECEAARRRRELAVQAALERLPELERQIVRQYHFDGASLTRIAAGLGIDTQTAINRYHRALRRLKRLLGGFVKSEFGLPPEISHCAICNSPARAEIERLLALRQPGERLGPMMRTIRRQFDARIISPMTIVAHLKYHTERNP
jgi:hypothetical protein